MSHVIGEEMLFSLEKCYLQYVKSCSSSYILYNLCITSYQLQKAGVYHLYIIDVMDNIFIITYFLSMISLGLAKSLIMQDRYRYMLSYNSYEVASVSLYRLYSCIESKITFLTKQRVIKVSQKETLAYVMGPRVQIISQQHFPLFTTNRANTTLRIHQLSYLEGRDYYIRLIA